MRFRLLALVLSLVASTAPAHALTTLQFVGTITSIFPQPGSFYSGVAVGDAISLTFVIDETAPDRTSNVTRGNFDFRVRPGTSFSGTIDGSPFQYVPTPSSVFTGSTFTSGALTLLVGGRPQPGAPIMDPAEAAAGSIGNEWDFRSAAPLSLPNDTLPGAIAALSDGHPFTLTYRAWDQLYCDADGCTIPLINEEFTASLVYVPVPEPSAFALVALGIAGLGLAGDRRNRSHPPC